MYLGAPILIAYMLTSVKSSFCIDLLSLYSIFLYAFLKIHYLAASGLGYSMCNLHYVMQESFVFALGVSGCDMQAQQLCHMGSRLCGLQ